MTDLFAAAIADRYRLEQEIGSGGTSIVYRATDLRHHRMVVVKRLRSEFGSQAAERFLREIRLVATLQHPDIVPLLDSGMAAGQLFSVMPLLEGETLRARLTAAGRLPIADAVRIANDVLDALGFAHRSGVVHRDIKPENIFLSGRHALVMDFGIAKAFTEAAGAPELTAGFAIGTPHYMAPEQATGNPDVDGRADLYAVGCVLYEMLVGRPPIGGPSPQEILAAHVSLTPERIDSIEPTIPAALADLVMRCLAKRPSDRWPSAETLLARLEPFGSTGTPTPAAIRAVPPRWSSWLPWIALTVTVLAVAWRAATDRPAASREPGQRQLTYSGNAVMAAISPDRKMLAYVADRGAGNELLVRDLASGSELSLAKGRLISSPTWSATGGEILYQYWDERGRGVHAIPMIGGTPRVIAQGFFKQPSPDGRRVAEVFELNDTIRVIDLVRSDTVETVLSTGHTSNLSAAWDATGRRLAISRDATERGRWAVVVLDVERRAVRVVAEDTVLLGAAIWSARGDAVYYLRAAGPFKALVRAEVGRDGEPRGQPTVIANGLELPSLFPGRLSASADGQAITYVRDQYWSNLAIGTVTGSTVDVAPFTSGTAMHASARFGPGDSVVAFFRSGTEGTTLVRRQLGSGEEETVARVLDGYDLAWGPVPGHLAAIIRGMDRRLGVMIYRPDGTTARFGEGSSGQYLGWAPGRHLAYQRAGAAAIGWLDPVTGIDTIAPLRHRGTVLWPRVAPDDAWIAFFWSREEPGESGLWISRPNGTEPRRVVQQILRPLRVSADGGAIYVASMGHDPTAAEIISRVEIASGTLHRVASLAAGWTAEDISPDGTRLVLNRIEHRADVWVIEHSEPTAE